MTACLGISFGETKSRRKVELAYHTSERERVCGSPMDEAH